ncbi:nacht nucleoside triphosphatase : Serine/threonine protein kinase with WD40 repeats OS=Microcystis aeruginosa (strain NIES-843) GN=MAE_17510 PE=4 SV=1: WD40: WD40 [Gemmata massiliana]|uniref:Uncharacterized protein n=1 Tax=Gemmata massiliana TaxID=1210884 RepID=A0A6P2CUI0_9BACT|nr:hypothetical protein [Gemmata massiliana]VTR91354.1 nacht nucleoside triphosphatase : Serine/threonine protein kinase with WD40 repeats OS=Microcystis aeruginosa (strain NIES-843) GN=MAE_17510 PE=4 SV=1: WD40: WD40 [Gemmata massiliana]
MLVFEGERFTVNAVALCPNGRYLATSTDRIHLRSLTNPDAEPVDLGHRGAAIGFLVDGRLVVAGSAALVIRPSQPKRGAVRFLLPENLVANAVLPDDRLLAASGTSTVTTFALCRIRPDRVEIESQVTVPGKVTVTATAVSPDAKWLAVGAPLSTKHGKARSGVRLCAFDRGEQVGELAEATGALNSLVWSPCGRFIAGTLNTRLVVWSAESGTLVGELEAGGTRLFRGPCFHSSGRFLAAGGANVEGGVYCWDVSTWKELVGYRWPVGPVVSVCFSSDGSLAAAGGERGGITVWDVD